MEQKTAVTVPEQELARQRGILEYIKEGWTAEFIKTRGRAPECCVVTYGCQMNEHDSEHLYGMLIEAGFVKAEREDADIILFNTCCVRDHAEQKVFGNIGALRKKKEQNPALIIGVCGCMMQQEKAAEALYRRFPFVDMVFGTHVLHQFPELLKNALEGGRVYDVTSSDGCVAEGMPSLRESGISAYTTIMYGCNNFCTYCVVPYVRGRERSRQARDIEKELQGLIASGCKEVTLLGQNVNSYGHDLEGGEDFPALLRRLDKLEGIGRIRFMTSHPKDLTDGLISAIAECKHVCHHIHLPVQSGSNDVLKRMNRRYTRERYFELVDKLRSAVPDIEITSDMIVGFPGETEQDFEDTLVLTERVGFSAIFTFKYSPRAGTPAAKLEQLDEEIKKARLARLNELQVKKCRENNEKYIGGVFDVLAEGYDLRENGVTVYGKTNTFKTIYFEGAETLVGSTVKVRVEGAHANSLIGKLIV